LWCAVAVQQVLATRERCLRVRDAVLDESPEYAVPGRRMPKKLTPSGQPPKAI